MNIRTTITATLVGTLTSLALAAPGSTTAPSPSTPTTASPAPAAPSSATTKPTQERPEALVSTERLMDAIRALPTKRSAFSTEEHAKGLRSAEQLLADQLKAMGYTPHLEEIDFLGGDRDGPPWHNVYVDLPGTTAPTEWLIIGAHFDAVARAPGADDNGSGTAALLEMARLLKDRPMQRSVRLIFFNLEETGLVGSRIHAGRLQPEIEAGKLKVVGMVSLDMLGFYSDKPNSQKSPIPPSRMFKPPTVADFIGLGGILAHRTFSQAWVKAMNQSEPACKVVAADFLPIAPPDLLRSDHAPFLAINVPAIILSDTANFRSPHYHQPTDTIETIDKERFTATTRAVIGATYRLAGEPGTELINLSPPQTESSETPSTTPAASPASNSAPAPQSPKP